MTETLSHIALRRLNGPEASEWYTPFSNVSLTLSADQTLIIDAPLVSPIRLVTNDIVEFNPQGQFRILGRKDNTINTGGVKVQIEQVEARLKPLLPFAFQITAAPDSKFGERIVLLVQSENPVTEERSLPAITSLLETQADYLPAPTPLDGKRKTRPCYSPQNSLINPDSGLATTCSSTSPF